MILVTHDRNLAARCDRILEMKDGFCTHCKAHPFPATNELAPEKK